MEIETRNEELLNAAGWLDGYMKENRHKLNIADQRAMYIAIRELVGLMSDEYKEGKKDFINVLISTEQDWIRYQSHYPV